MKNLFILMFILILTFFLFTAFPADPVRTMLGINASEDAVQSLRQELGINNPLYIRFIDYIKNLFSLNFGTSYTTRRAVGPDLFNAFLSTQVYIGLALMLSICYSVLSVFIMYFGKSTIEKLINGFNSFMTSLPALVLAIIFGIFFLKFNIFNFIENINLRYSIIAASVLSIYPSCSLSQILNNEFKIVRTKQYILASSSFGYKRNKLFFIIFRNSFLPWLSQLSNIIAVLLSGSIIIEYVFSLPGMGRLIFQSIQRSDFPMLQAIVLVTSITFIFINILIEKLYDHLVITRKS